MGEETMPRVICIWNFFFALLFMLVPVETRAFREIPDDNLAYPVRITSEYCINPSRGEASGFSLNTETATYLITARHVLFTELK
jgi:hypothetical protein